MGYQTDYVGYLRIEPPLDEDEIELVNAISGWAGHHRYAPGPRAARPEEAAIQQLIERAPRGWSNWSACSQGCCLSYDGGDKANHMVPWLRFLLSSVIVPDAEEDPPARGRVVNGMVVGSRRDTRELLGITVRSNHVEIELLWPGEPRWSDYPPLAYQVEIDRFRAWAQSRPESGA